VAQQTFDLKHIQAGRVWSAKVATSGFGGDVDITDPRAAIGFLPIGIMYVLFAPFPWMVTNLRQLITLPELIAWWALVPMMIRGYWFLMKHRLRESFAICVFIVGLIFAYALYQSNTGTAYRHRAQLYPFFFVFISVRDCFGVAVGVEAMTSGFKLGAKLRKIVYLTVEDDPNRFIFVVDRCLPVNRSIIASRLIPSPTDAACELWDRVSRVGFTYNPSSSGPR